MSHTIPASSLKSAIKLMSIKGIAGLDEELMGSCLNEIMSGQGDPVQISAFLTFLQPVTSIPPNLIARAAWILRSHSVKFVDPSKLSGIFGNSNLSKEIIDIVGTGGDGRDTFNASSAASLVCSSDAFNLLVIKHGNRSSSSKSGSADLLQCLGANINKNLTKSINISDNPDLHCTLAHQVLNKSNFIFLFAQAWHPLMKNVSSIRSSLSFRTLFNLLGPLSNPCTPKYQLTGVYDRALGPIFANAFATIGVANAMVVHSDDGMDEFSPCSSSHYWWMKKDPQSGSVSITEGDVTPFDFGISEYHTIDSITSGTPAENAETLKIIFDPLSDIDSPTSKLKPLADYICMNASAALVVSGRATSFKEGAAIARQAIKSGDALKNLNKYVEASNEVSDLSEDKKSASGSPSILKEIAIHRRTLAEASSLSYPLTNLLSDSLSLPSYQPARSFVPSIINNNKTSVIAEIKRASPSAGIISSDINPYEQALKYAAGGAVAISVLCEPKWFKGNFDDFRAVRKALNTIPLNQRPSLLLKDFVETPYQIYEARIMGADSVLLIVASLIDNNGSDAKLNEFIQISRSLGMEPLVEVANDFEMKVALNIGATCIGVNNRNLHTFTVDSNTTVSLASIFHKHFESLDIESIYPVQRRPVLIALSGIKIRKDVEAYEQVGAKAVLIGESLMKHNDPSQFIKVLVGENDINPPLFKPKSSIASNKNPLVKICGIRNVDDALCAAREGADLIGLIFVEKSKRFIKPEDAKEIVKQVRSIYPPSIQSAAAENKNSLFNLMDSVQGNDAAEVLSKRWNLLYEFIKNQRRPLVVGVFQNASEEKIKEVLKEVPLDLIQLHGDESFDFAVHFPIPSIRVFGVNSSTDIQLLSTQLNQKIKSPSGLESFCPNTACLLLDTKLETSAPSTDNNNSSNNNNQIVSGGTGTSFDWSVAHKFGLQGFPVFVAGGLHPDNLNDCLQTSHAAGLDTSSGVEATDSTGTLRKFHTKILNFIVNAKIKRIISP